MASREFDVIIKDVVNTSGSAPMAQNDSSLIQEKLSARQAKRSAKAGERQEKSDALKEEGNAFFRNGNFSDAVDRYQQAIEVHGPSVKPVLLSNLAAAYLKLGMYPEAHDAADKALAADPTSVKARYRRGMARKHMEMWTAANIDFTTMLTLDPSNKEAEAEREFVEERRVDPFCWEEDADMYSYSDHEAPALVDDPELGESLSESSDCEHTGNGIPCKFYNRTECKNGRACRYSHAPDQKSERDALGRNVCRYYLHSKEYLLQQGWWSTTEGIEKEKRDTNCFKCATKRSPITTVRPRPLGQDKRQRRSNRRGRKNVVIPLAWDLACQESVPPR
ncbi:TPR-like protein [Imleria badia]|nr:TPR-like protein [Imleria badia]